MARLGYTAGLWVLFVSLASFADGTDSGSGGSPNWKQPSSSPTGMADFRKKAEEKENSRWTLADWLAQKERNRMMDLWLGMYSPSPYELILGGFYNGYTLNIDNPPSVQTNQFAIGGTLAFYALILGGEGFYINNTDEAYIDDGGMIALRVMGRAVQNTHLILQYGERTKKSSTFNLQQQFGAADLDIYVERHSGLHGNYRVYIPTNDPVLGAVTGNRWEGGLFFNINFIQLIGGWYSELQTNTLAATTVNQTRSGGFGALKLFF